MIVQVIGLPCSGKTTIINSVIKKNPEIKYYDIRMLSEVTEIELLNNINKDSQNSLVILESALGFFNLKSFVIHYKANNSQYQKNLNFRQESISQIEKQRLLNEMIPANYTVYTDKDFSKIINILYKKEKNE